MANVFLVDLEPVETRYTAQWKEHIPKLLTDAGHNVQVLSGPKDIPSATTPGAFLNFGGTNIYKSLQVEGMGRLFCAGAIKPGDHFLFTDAWHPGIINLKYMSELLQIPVTIHALWHAGSYDPHDFLGRLIGEAAWVRNAEKSFFNAIDHNYFATDFHIEMFFENLLGIDNRTGRIRYMPKRNVVRTGWPMEYMPMTLLPYRHMAKRDLIIFPHRIAPEKQVEIFRGLQQQLPEFEFVVCQDQELTKNEYHTLLGQAKMVFSCSLQETLGISAYEGALLDAMPIVPDRLSYKEMYGEEFKYPSHWTENYASYLHHRDKLVNHVRVMMQKYDYYKTSIQNLATDLTKQYFSADNLIENIR